MKRYSDLYPQITTFENLLAAAKQAQRQKRYRDSVLAFNDRLEHELLQLQPGAWRHLAVAPENLS